MEGRVDYCWWRCYHCASLWCYGRFRWEWGACKWSERTGKFLWRNWGCSYQIWNSSNSFVETKSLQWVLYPNDHFLWIVFPLYYDPARIKSELKNWHNDSTMGRFTSPKPSKNPWSHPPHAHFFENHTHSIGQSQRNQRHSLLRRHIANHTTLHVFRIQRAAKRSLQSLDASPTAPFATWMQSWTGLWLVLNI